MSEELLLKILANTEQLKTELQGHATEHVDKFHEHVKEVFADIAKAAGVAFSVEKVAEWAKEGIQDLARFEQAWQNLSFQIENTHTPLEKVSEDLERWVQNTELTSRFNKIELVSSLSSAILKTQDYQSAIALQRMAMDLSVRSGRDLGETLNAITLAYEGNKRGLMQLSRWLGVTGSDAENVGKVFKIMEERTKDAAKQEDNLAVKLKTTTAAWHDMWEELAKFVRPALVDVLYWTKESLKELNNWNDTLAKKSDIARTNSEYEKNLMQFGAVYAAKVRDHELAEIQKHYDAANQAAMANVETERKAGDEKVKAHLKMLEEKKDLDDLYESATGIQKAAHEQTKKLKAEEKLWEDAGESTMQLADKMAQDQEEAAKRAGHGIAAESARLTGSLIRDVQQGENIFAAGSKAMAHYMIDAFAEILIQSGVKKLIESGLDMSNPFTAFFAGGEATAGAEAIAAGGAMKAVAATFLADGGYVMEPTLAVIGEAGPEKVVPLSKGPMPGEGGAAVEHYHFHIGQVNGPGEMKRFMKSSSLTFIETKRDAERRTGRRLQAGVS